MAFLVVYVDLDRENLKILANPKLKVKATKRYEHDFKQVQKFCRKRLQQSPSDPLALSEVRSMVHTLSYLLFGNTILGQVQVNQFLAKDFDETLVTLSVGLKHALLDADFNLNREFELSDDVDAF